MTGRFSLHSLPRNYRLLVVFERAGFARQVAVLDTGAAARVTEIRFHGAPDETVPVLRSPLAVALNPTRVAVVTVVDHAGQPVNSGAVEVIDSERHFAGWEVVDARGTAEIAFSKPGRYQFLYADDPLKPRLGTFVTAEFAENDMMPAVEIRLPESRWLTGRVVDAETGQGVVGAYVFSARDDGFAQTVSGPDGAFRLPVAIGPGRVHFNPLPMHGYFPPDFRGDTKPAGTPIEVSALEPVAPLVLKLGRGLVVRGTVRDAQGEPVAGARVDAQDTEWSLKAAATTNDQGRFEIVGVSPRMDTRLSVVADSGAASTDVPAEPDHPWDKSRFVNVELTLKPGVSLTGRVLKGETPRANVNMRLYRLIAGTLVLYAERNNDAAGRYRIAGLQPGDQYAFEIADPDGLIAPGWDHQQPFFQTVPVGKAEIALPDVKLATRGQSLRGVVVDPDGKPVARVKIFASLTDGRRLIVDGDGPPSWTETDASGLFQLQQLPDEPIELTAYRQNPDGVAIRFPAKARPALNQQNIRILLDPSLTDEVEDLDAPKKGADSKD